MFYYRFQTIIVIIIYRDVMLLYIFGFFFFFARIHNRAMVFFAAKAII